MGTPGKLSYFLVFFGVYANYTKKSKIFLNILPALATSHGSVMVSPDLNLKMSDRDTNEGACLPGDAAPVTAEIKRQTNRYAN